MTISDNLTRRQIIELLASEGEERKSLFETAACVKREQVGEIIYFKV